MCDGAANCQRCIDAAKPVVTGGEVASCDRELPRVVVSVSLFHNKNVFFIWNLKQPPVHFLPRILVAENCLWVIDQQDAFTGRRPDLVPAVRCGVKMHSSSCPVFGQGPFLWELGHSGPESTPFIARKKCF